MATTVGSDGRYRPTEFVVDSICGVLVQGDEAFNRATVAGQISAHAQSPGIGAQLHAQHAQGRQNLDFDSLYRNPNA